MKKIILITLLALSSLFLSGCANEDVEFSKSVNKYYDYLEDYSYSIYSDSYSAKTTDKEYINDAISSSYNDELFNSNDYMGLCFTRKEDVVFKSVTFSIQAKVDCTLNYIWVFGNDCITDYGNGGKTEEVELKAGVSQTFTIQSIGEGYDISVPGTKSTDIAIAFSIVNPAPNNSPLTYDKTIGTLTTYNKYELDLGIRIFDISFNFN